MSKSGFKVSSEVGGFTRDLQDMNWAVELKNFEMLHFFWWLGVFEILKEGYPLGGLYLRGGTWYFLVHKL